MFVAVMIVNCNYNYKFLQNLTLRQPIGKVHYDYHNDNDNGVELFRQCNNMNSQRLKLQSLNSYDLAETMFCSR